MKKITVLFITLVMLLTAFAACGKKNGGKNGKSGGRSEKGKYTAELPDVDYKGYKFRILQREHGQGWGEKGFFAEVDTTDVFESAVYTRNSVIEGEYGVKLDVIEVEDRNIAGGALYRKAFSSLSASADDYDVILPSAYDAITLSGSGLLLDLNGMEYIDLDADWWAKSLNDSIAIGGKQYFAVSDTMFNDKLDSGILLFNKSILKEIGKNEPYSLVDSHEWTLDKFKEYLTDYGADMNNDGIAGYEDKYGAFLFEMSGIVVGSGITGATLNEDGIPEINDITDKMTTTFDKIFSIVNTPYMTFNMYHYSGDKMDEYSQTSPNEVIDAIWRKFRDGDTLFCGCAVETVAYYLRDMEDFGILPYPLADDNQKDYINRVGHTGVTFITIPFTVEDESRSAIVTEALSCEAKNFISPAFYDQLIGQKSVRDDDSAKMLDIIFSHGVLDLDMIYEWGAFVTRWHTLITEGSYELSSMYNECIDVANERLGNTLQSLGLE